MRLSQGTALGRYVIEDLLGRGGMGEVYRARDTELGREVALKVIAAAVDADRLARFNREARTTALLAHPNIVTIFDVGVHDTLPFLVTELLHGETLRRRLAQGRLDLRTAIELSLQLARGMAAAHALRIVHRDLKPENLFLSRDGVLKILDFGLAKLRSEAVAGSDGTTMDLSGAGLVLGTPAYMSPEQLRGEPVDERTDIFAAGVILFEMVTGRHPFRTDSIAATIGAILRDTPSPGGSVSPPALERLILRCLEKDSADRYSSAADLAFSLESLLADLRSGRSPVRQEEPKAAAPSIAVLPFADMSATRDQDYLCEGLAEELITALTHVEGLRVAARTSSFVFKGATLDVQAVGTRLGVATVLEGGVRKSGDRLRVTVRLVDVAGGYQLWGGRFDRSLEDVFAIQDEIAENVATALRGILTADEKQAIRRPETGVDAYEYFLRGRQLLNQWNRAQLDAARRMFERALEIDPDYAPAWAGLCLVHCSLYEWWGGGPDDVEAAERASRKALALSPGLAEARAARGFVLSLERRYEEAEREFQEAIRLNPNSFEAHYQNARSCFAWGRPERSVKPFRDAADVRREDFQSLMLLAQSLSVLGRQEEAVAATVEGVQRAERQLELDPTDPRALSLGSTALITIGQPDRALQWAGRALELHPDDQGVLINAACTYARADLPERALDLLEKTFARGYGKRDWIEHDPDYDSLRDHPRFRAMLEKLR